MADTWHSKDIPEGHPVTLMGWVRVVLRAVPLIVLVFGGLAILLLVRLIEAPLNGPRRPVTPYITQGVCRGAFAILGLRYRSAGVPLRGAGAVVANHSSWLDIFALNARKRIYFVAKEEVSGWAGIGWLARATGTVFIKRDRRETQTQITAFRERLAAGHKLLFFPEGTSTDGLQVLAFKPTLFAAFFDPDLPDDLHLQAVTVAYDAPDGADDRFYGWWGNMDFAPHLLSTLAARRQGSVTVYYHPPRRLSDYQNRKTLSKALEEDVREGLERHRCRERGEG